MGCNIQGARGLNYEINPNQKGIVLDIPKNRFTRQVVITESGKAVQIPATIGAYAKVKALGDGTYELTTQTTSIGSRPKVSILTEDELIAKFGKTKSKFHAVG